MSSRGQKGIAEQTRQAELCEKYLDRMLAKLRSSQDDLDKNWMAQITSVALSLAVVAGLGNLVSKKLFDDASRSAILYVVLPAVNSYFFIRFGLIAETFSKASFNAQQIVEHLQSMNAIPSVVDASQIYGTNSYFEWAHHRSSVRTLLFLLTIPIVFSLNHALTTYLVYKLLGPGLLSLGFLVAYALVCAACYGAYYKSNKANTPVHTGRENWFILLVIVVAIVGTVLLFAALQRYDRDRARFILGDGRSAAAVTRAA